MRFIGRVLFGLLGALIPALFALHLWIGIQRDAGFDPEAFIAAARAYDAEIIRDNWGVPHIRGERDADVAFGLAYAHAEDDWDTLQEILDFYRAELGLSQGFEGLQLDYLVHLLRIRETVAEGYGRLSTRTQALVEGYAAGLNYYAATHPEQSRIRLFPVVAGDVVAGFVLQHLLFYGFRDHVEALFEPLPAPAPETAPRPRGSNAVAVAAARSSDTTTRIFINSHQPLEGPLAWYEARVHSGQGWNFMGGLFPGMPVFAKGFNPHLAWGPTVNKPDLVDTYVLELNPEDPNQYLLDGNWVDFEVGVARLRVDLPGNLYWTFERELLRSVHGPVLRRPHGTYALRFAGDGEFRQIEQWYRMNKARNLDEWRQAMTMQAIPSFNFVYADRDDNIAFFYNAALPLRSPEVNWQGHLPGGRSDLVWRDRLAFEALPRVVNPASGYLVSANQTPFAVSDARDNPRAADFPLARGIETRMTNRAHRALRLLAVDEAISREEFVAIKYDNRYALVSKAGQRLARQLIVPPGESPGGLLGAAREVLRRWDLSTGADNRQAALGVCVLWPNWVVKERGADPADERDVLERCAQGLRDNFGSLEVPWGRVNRLVRGDSSWPLSGGPDTLRAVYSRDPDGDGRRRATAGDGLVIFVEWDAAGRQRSLSIHPYGSATGNPDSPHYRDQAPHFAAQRLKRTFFEPAALDANTSSRLRIPHPPASR